MATKSEIQLRNREQPISGFAHIASGRESRPASERVPRHRHGRAYAAIVLAGSYEECGSRGRFRVGAGDVLLHDAFEAHLDHFHSSGAQILNLVDTGLIRDFAVGHVGDPDAIARAAERGLNEASTLLREQLCESARSREDWPDILARDLQHDPGCRLDRWANKHGLASETVSRGFGKVFGIAPAAFRAEARAGRALARIVGSDVPLAAIAAAEGFADQAHMSRAVRALTGMPPGAWRRSNSFKTVRARAT
jgi:AraC-like DNA-binding protein